MTMNSRPDFSDYVAHFTKDSAPLGDNNPPIVGDAAQRLNSILTSKRITATSMPWTNRKAVAFTECPWGSLVSHTKQYSPYGLGFRKSKLFAAGGGPAIYLRADLRDKQMDFQHKDHPQWVGLHPDLYAFVTPFSPPYAPAEYKSKHWKGKKPIDYSHEREWRVPHDFSFDYIDVEFVVVPNYDSVAKFPKDFKDAIGREKFIMVDNYAQIEKLWPVHII